MLNPGAHISDHAKVTSSEEALGYRDAFADILRRALFRNRVQLLGGISLAIGLPLITRFGLTDLPLSQDVVYNTIVGSLFAISFGFLFFRRLIDYPGTEGIAYSVPVFAVTFGAVLIAFLFLRLEYSRYLFASSYLLSVTWFTAISIAMVRLRTLRIGIVPGGESERLLSLRSVQWQEIKQPDATPAKLDAIVADLRHSFPLEWERFIAEAAVSGTPVYDVKHLCETLTGRLEIEHLSENTLGSLNPNDMFLKVKQAVDWLIALVVMAVLIPVFFIIAIAIRIESRGPAIFRQQRMGYRGQVFTLYKFRTMRSEETALSDERDRAITKADDSRVTRLGHFLRRTRIDELPQMINILRGEMSWIGPRPEAVPLSEWYEKELPFYRYRHIVRPGISGWAQVMQGHVAAPDQVLEKLHYDFYYIKNFSPWLDLLIVLKTIRTMLTGFGAR